MSFATSNMAATPAATRVKDDSEGYNSNRTYKYTAEEMALMEVGRQRYINRKREEEEDNMRVRIELELERPQKRSRGDQGGTIDSRNTKPSHLQSNRSSTGNGRKIVLAEEKEQDSVLRTERQQLSIQLALLADRLEPSPVETFAAFIKSSQACLRSPSPPRVEDTRALVRSFIPGSSAQSQSRGRRAVSLSNLEPRESSAKNTSTLSRNTQDLFRTPLPRNKTNPSRVPRSSTSQLRTASPTPAPQSSTSQSQSLSSTLAARSTLTPQESCEEILQLFEKPGQNPLATKRRTARERRKILNEVDKVIASHDHLSLPRSRSHTPMDHRTISQQMPSPPDSAESAVRLSTYHKNNTPVSKLTTRFGSLATPATSQKSSSSSPFNFASSSTMFQDTSVFASTPKHPELVTAVNPSMLMLRDAEIENGHIDGDGLIGFDSFFLEEVMDNGTPARSKSTHIEARSAPPSHSSHTPDDSLTSAESHTLANTYTLDVITVAIPATQAPAKRKSTRISTSKPTKPPTTIRPKLPSPRLSPSPDTLKDTSQFVPLKVRASRPTPDGLQLLIEWEEYPLEKDFSWELESELSKSVPEFVKAWWILESKAREEGGNKVVVKGKKPVNTGKKTVRKKAAGKTKVEEEQDEEFLVEKILEKRNFKGVLHYLVKWVGYDAVNERTWEPAESLGEYVPDLIEGFEIKRSERKKGSGKGKTSGKGGKGGIVKT